MQDIVNKVFKELSRPGEWLFWSRSIVDGTLHLTATTAKTRVDHIVEEYTLLDDEALVYAVSRLLSELRDTKYTSLTKDIKEYFGVQVEPTYVRGTTRTVYCDHPRTIAVVLLRNHVIKGVKIEAAVCNCGKLYVKERVTNDR